MNYKEPNTEPEDNEGIDISADTGALVDDELQFDTDEFTTDDEALLEEELRGEAKKTKSQTKTFSLQARRAIEDHLEQRRLRKELDYLFDDEFANNPEAKDK